MAASVERGHQLFPIHSHADSCCGIVPTATHGPSPSQETDGCPQARLLPDVYQLRFGPPLQVFPHSTQDQGARLPSRPVHTPGSQCHATQLEDSAPLPPVRTHLPVDALAHLTLPLLEGLSYAPLINSTLLPDLPALPSDEIMTNAYRALKRRAQSLMMKHWRSLPLPDYYPVTG